MNDTLDLDAYIATGKAKRATVTLYMDQAAIAPINELMAERARLEAEALAGTEASRSLADTSPLADVEARLSELLEQFEESASTWTLAPVTSDEYEVLFGKYPDPPAPRKPLPDAAPQAWTKYEKAVAAWRSECVALDAKRNLEYVATSVESVEAQGKTTTTVTPETLANLRSRPNGKELFEALLRAAINVTKGEVDPPLPK